jgi:hypothetical protein
MPNKEEIKEIKKQHAKKVKAVEDSKIIKK